MRAKLKIESILKTEHGETLKMRPVSDKPFDPDGNSEDNSFAKWTPSGVLELNITNPALIGQFKPGDSYYLDFTKVEN